MSQFYPGYVARQVINGVVHTYGEGLNPLQSPAFIPQWIQDIGNQAVWGWQMNDLIRKAIFQCGCVD